MRGSTSVIQEFKDFINKGNIIELAVAVVMATAFAPVVAAFVDGVLMNIVAAIFGQPNFDSLKIDIGDSAILYGTVITAIINFIFVALAVFFVLKAYNATKEDEEEESGPSEVDLLTEIRDALQNR
jgi:large conductance mechanosensitive channel